MDSSLHEAPRARRLLHRASALLLALLAAAASAERPVPVGVTTARTATVSEEVALHGSLVARRVSELSAEIDGLVEEVTVDDGDLVELGEVLVSLDDRLATIEQSAARARLEEARAVHAEAVRRARELEALGSTRHVAETQVAAALAQIDIEAARVEQARAELEQAGEMLRRHRVRAPFDAVVGRKLAERGEWVETNTPLLELVDVDTLRLEVAVPQFYFSQVEQGTAVEIRMDALPDRLFEARVTRKVPISDTASRTFRVRVDIPNGDRALAPGMSARVVFRLAGADTTPVLVLPRDAVVRKPDGSVSVWVIETEDGVSTARPRAIETGRAYRDHVEVVAGDVSVGDKVVVRGNEILRPGQFVRIAEEPARDL
ncbi:MAG: efflux RND transporter periplasmic adaptor subunit [Gammaproteobacteria bacterium]